MSALPVLTPRYKLIIVALVIAVCCATTLGGMRMNYLLSEHTAAVAHENAADAGRQRLRALRRRRAEGEVVARLPEDGVHAVVAVAGFVPVQPGADLPGCLQRRPHDGRAGRVAVLGDGWVRGCRQAGCQNETR